VTSGIIMSLGDRLTLHEQKIYPDKVIETGSAVLVAKAGVA